MLGKADGAAPGLGAPTSTPVDTTATALALRELSALAAAEDTELLLRFAQLRDALAPLPPGFCTQLEKAVQDLDFPFAHALCRDMLRTLAV